MIELSLRERPAMIVTPPPGRVYLLRHAKAAWASAGQRDFDRPLDERGYDDAELVADRAAERGYRPDLVVSSTALRCRDTAEAIRRAFPGELEVRYVDQLYNCPAETYGEMLGALGDFTSVMMVGHNPAIEEVLAALIGAEAMAAAIPGGFPAGGLAVIDHVDQDAAADVPAAPGKRWQLIDFVTG